MLSWHLLLRAPRLTQELLEIDNIYSISHFVQLALMIKMVPWLRLHLSNAGSLGSIPG